MLLTASGRTVVLPTPALVPRTCLSEGLPLPLCPDGPSGFPALPWRRDWGCTGKGIPGKKISLTWGSSLVDHSFFTFWGWWPPGLWPSDENYSLSPEVYTHAYVILIWTQVFLCFTGGFTFQKFTSFIHEGSPVLQAENSSVGAFSEKTWSLSCFPSFPPFQWPCSPQLCRHGDFPMRVLPHLFPCLYICRHTDMHTQTHTPCYLHIFLYLLFLSLILPGH